MKLLYETALSFLNQPYLWGGDQPIGGGFDCSGLVGELLKSIGAHPDPKTRYTAQMFFNFFKEPANHKSQDPQFGALVFFGQDDRSIEHIGLCMNRRRMIEAGGGGHLDTSLSQAIKDHAFVKIRPVPFTSAKFRGAFMPDYDLAEL